MGEAVEEAELDVHVGGITCEGTVVRLEGDVTGPFEPVIFNNEKRLALGVGKIDLPANKCHHP